jgi:regulator of replication initiation timing
VELRQKVGNLEHDILELKTQNASLGTENSMLKQQMLFLEKVLIEHQKDRGKELDSFLMFSPNMD